MQKTYFNSQDARDLINQYGFAIFPIHGTRENGSCTCNNPNCANIGKHPATPDGFKSASKDIEQVKKLWSGRKGLNVGVATGEASGVFVIDIDSAEAEKEFYAKFTIPDTYTVQTGRGKHLYFSYDPNHPVKNGSHIIPGVDVRGNGGYVAGAGSNHVSGVIYSVLNPDNLTGTPLDFAPCPKEIYDFIEKDKHTKPLFEPKPKLFDPPREGWSIDQIRGHLAHISPDIGYDDWVRVGMALHQEGVPEAIWDEWSAKGVKYKGSQDINFHWRSFNKGGGVSYGTVVNMAKQGGWAPQSPSSVIAKPEIPQSTIAAQTPQSKQPSSELYYIAARDISFSIDDNSLVKDVLGQEELSVIYGESNCGKTFFMTDLSFHIARGLDWRGHRVAQGGVMYAALEGARGLSKRFEAYCVKNSISRDFPFAVMPCALDFYSESANITQFIDLIKRSQDDIGDPKLIVIDTLSRALAGGDENSGQDMGRLVNYADLIRYETKAHLSFVHHSGKNKALGARGHSSLRAAIDTEIEISREEEDDFSLVRFVKQREVEIIDDLAFGLERVVIGVNRFTEEITSCVVVEAEQIIKASTDRKMTDAQQFVFDAIVSAIDDYGRERMIYGKNIKSIKYHDFYGELEKRGFQNLENKDGEVDEKRIINSSRHLRVALKEKGLINFTKEFIWLV